MLKHGILIIVELVQAFKVIVLITLSRRLCRYEKLVDLAALLDADTSVFVGANLVRLLKIVNVEFWPIQRLIGGFRLRYVVLGYCHTRIGLASPLDEEYLLSHIAFVGIVVSV
mmetsp:Transcript_20955/g.24635  ORF Transcript_20955/g.24635 Transcript_20955/m.24635 type:complete len:113 (-) Transcript_20955:56-394(-)